MSERWERAILEWYERSGTSHLEYLDLASFSKVSNKDLSNNIAVIFDRLSLFSRVSIKNYKKIFESLESLKVRISGCESEIQKIEREIVTHTPLTKRDLKVLFTEIAAQPKLIEAEAISISKELDLKLKRVEDLLHKVENWLRS